MEETILQFGTGNFLRGFFDYFIDVLNKKNLYNGKIVVVQPTRHGKAELINLQEKKYNLIMRGIENGRKVSQMIEINSLSRGVDPYENFNEYVKLAENPALKFIVSNTTEAGIEFKNEDYKKFEAVETFPGKLTQLLYHRFKMNLPGFNILACELIDNNGKELENCVLKYVKAWNLGEDFFNWVISDNLFCNTLVDRIVSGYPKDEASEISKKIGYEDKLLDVSEIFHLWVVEGNFENELPLRKAGLNVIWTDNVKPYKKMKVRILNGSHTSLVFPSLLASVETVGESLNDKELSEFLKNCLNKYILPCLNNQSEAETFKEAVIERFKNPYIKHRWKSISLNSVCKFSERVLPTAVDYNSKLGKAPKELCLSLAALIYYYKNYDPEDNLESIEFIRNNDIETIVKNKYLWGKNIEFMTELTSEAFNKIANNGIREALRWAML